MKTARGHKVGFFDSGVGGLSVLRAFQALCPEVETEYLADSAHAPYGNCPAEEIARLSEANAEELIARGWLIARGCDVVVVACNTATAAAIDLLRRKHPEIPFVGMEPAVKPAALRSKSGVVAVLATAGTFRGRLYNETKGRYAGGVKVIAAVADEFVAEAERIKGAPYAEWTEADRARIIGIVRARVEPLLDAGADVIVLGCTHFPLLIGAIEEVCAGRAEVIDPSPAVARQIRRVLA